MERLKLHVDVSLSGMNGCMLDEGSNNLHADTSFSGPFVVQGRILRFGACTSHDIRLHIKNRLTS